jgi:DNA-binding transcriptional LysR family regulator
VTVARAHFNRSGELEIFVRIVELGGFSAAARAYGLTPSAVSKLVSRLEQRLGARLLHRSTRQFQLTPVGCVYYEQGRRILADLEEAERSASVHAVPRGRVRISANVPLGHHFLLPAVPRFMQQYPDVALDVSLGDEVIDILQERTDVAIRAGFMRNSNLVARRLGGTRMIVVGAPSYLAQRGTPRTPEDLDSHVLLSATYARAQPGWPFRDGTRAVMVPPGEHLRGSDGEALRRLAVAGAGLARLAAFQANDDIHEGRLVPVLEAFNPGDIEDIHAVYVGQGGQVPARVRVFLDFLAGDMRSRGMD